MLLGSQFFGFKIASFATVWMQNLQIWWMIKEIFATSILIDWLFVFMGIILSQKKKLYIWSMSFLVVDKKIPHIWLQGPLMFPHPKAEMGNSKILCSHNNFCWYY